MQMSTQIIFYRNPFPMEIWLTFTLKKTFAFEKPKKLSDKIN